MKFRIAAGTELDVLTPAEARQLWDSFRAELAAASGTETIRAAQNGRTDANGAIVLDVYTVPIGMVCTVRRVLVEADGFTPGAPFVAAAGYLDVLRSSKRAAFVSLAAAAGGLPALLVDGSASGIKARNGEAISVSIVGGPASTNVEVTVQAELVPSRLPGPRSGS